jgi:hypothetical protein
MSKNKKPRKPASARKGWLWIGGALTFAAVAAVVWFVISSSSQSPPASDGVSDVAAGLRSSDTAFNVGTRIGQPAPAFAIRDAQGQPYKFQPGDGRQYVLAFNMGYV